MSAAPIAGITNITGGSVSARCLLEMYHSINRAGMRADIATPQGGAPEYVCEDSAARGWIKDNMARLSTPLAIHEVQASDYVGLCLPSGIGSVADLAKDKELGRLVVAFLETSKPICAVGNGVAGLCMAASSSGSTSSSSWSFDGYNMTALSNAEQVRFPYFCRLPLVIEDFIKDNGAHYSTSQPDAVHVVVDRNVVTGQNDSSALLAVHSFVWLISNASVRL